VSLLLRGGVDADGAPVEVRTDPAAGRITDVGVVLAPQPGDDVLDTTGMVLLPAPAEPHAHLDKALTAHLVPNARGDLAGAIEAWHAHWPTLTEDDIAARARLAVEELVAHGTTAIRSHVDVGLGIGLTGMRALIGVREELATAGLADLQLVALMAAPRTPEEAAPLAALAAEAMALGADVVGGCPHLHADQADATARYLGLATDTAKPIDLHTDETLDPEAQGLGELARLVRATGFPHGATASHCCSLGVQPPQQQREVAAAVAGAGVSVVTLPQTNLFLQARGVTSAPPRGLTAVRTLLDAGANVCAGADNVRDPFNGVGRSDALETASLLIVAAHLTAAEAWRLVSHNARRAMGLPVVELTPGAPAELLAVRGASLSDAIARGSEHRIVIHHGRCVARTEVATALMPLSPAPSLT
jgi:cytosine/creatinine deaminase